MNTVAAQLSFHRAALPGFGMPDERLARMAARRAFVEMKTCFMRAADEVDGQVGAMLQRKIRLAGEVAELGRLAQALLAALPRGKAGADMHRHELLQQLESAFPEGGGPTAFVPL